MNRSTATLFACIATLVSLHGTASSLPAQYAEAIRTGRPGQAIGPFAVGKRVFQLQAGVESASASDIGQNEERRTLSESVVLRFGVSRFVEINGAWSVARLRREGDGELTVSQGLSSASLGTRIHLAAADGSRPALGLQLSLKLPVLAQAFDAPYVAPRLLLIGAKRIGDNANVLVNGGLDWNGVDARPTGLYILNAGYSLSPRWSVFIENYGDVQSGALTQRWDTGVALLVNNDLQFDLSGGIGRNASLRDAFVSAGISWRTAALHRASALRAQQSHSRLLR